MSDDAVELAYGLAPPNKTCYAEVVAADEFCAPNILGKADEVCLSYGLAPNMLCYAEVVAVEEFGAPNTLGCAEEV